MMSSTVVSGKDMLSGHEVRSVEVGCPYLISSAAVVVAAACSRGGRSRGDSSVTPSSETLRHKIE